MRGSAHLHGCEATHSRTTEASQELVVGGFTDPQGTRAGRGALLVGYFAQDDDFVFAGKVGTGLDTRMLLDLRTRLNALEIPTSPFTKAPSSSRRMSTSAATCAVPAMFLAKSSRERRFS